MDIKILNGLEKKMDEFNENFNNNIKTNQSKVKNSVTKIEKNTLEAINSRLEDAEWISNLEDRVMKAITLHSKKKKEK